MITVSTFAQRNAVPRAVLYVLRADGLIDVYQEGDTLPALSAYPAPDHDAYAIYGGAVSIQGVSGVDTSGASDSLAAFSAALTNAAADGVAVMMQGARVLCAGTLYLPSNLVLHGPGEIVIADDGSATGRIVRIQGTASVPATGVRLQNIHITSAGKTGRTGVMGLLTLKYARDIDLQNVRVSNSSGQGILAILSEGVRIRGAVVVDCEADGIHISRQSRDVQVSQSLVSNCGDDGISIVSYRKNEGVDIGPCERVTVSDSVVRDSDKEGSGLVVIGGRNITFAGCHTYKTAQAGIKIEYDPAANVLSHANVGITATGCTVEQPGQFPLTEHGAAGLTDGVFAKHVRGLTLDVSVLSAPGRGCRVEGAVLDADINIKTDGSGGQGVFIECASTSDAIVVQQLLNDFGDSGSSVGGRRVTLSGISTNAGKEQLIAAGVTGFKLSEFTAAYSGNPTMTTGASVTLNGIIDGEVSGLSAAALLSAQALNLQNCNRVNITGGLLKSAAGSVVYVPSGTDITIRGAHLYGSGVYAINEEPACIRCSYIGNHMAGYSGGKPINFQATGANGSAGDWIASDGSLKYRSRAGTVTTLGAA